MDYTQREYKVLFFGWGDIIAKIGGLRSAIMPVIEFFTPLLIVYFLVQLS